VCHNFSSIVKLTSQSCALLIFMFAADSRVSEARIRYRQCEWSCIYSAQDCCFTTARRPSETARGMTCCPRIPGTYYFCSVSFKSVLFIARAVDPPSCRLGLCDHRSPYSCTGCLHTASAASCAADELLCVAYVNFKQHRQKWPIFHVRVFNVQKKQ
jgi:hypothetical protein